MKTDVGTENGKSQSQNRPAVSRAIDWIQNYIDENPYSESAKEARSIVQGLRVVRQHPSLDELLALIGQIAKSDLGLKEISRAKVRMSQPEKTTGEEPYAVGTGCQRMFNTTEERRRPLRNYFL